MTRSAPTAPQIKRMREKLVGLDPALAKVDAETPVFAWRTRDGGYMGLLEILVAQQVSTAAANAIWARFMTGVGEATPERVLATSEENLRSFGLSRPKVRYFRAIAEAAVEGRIDFAALGALDDEAALNDLLNLPGVGRWTAEIYLMFSEHRLDFFPGADIALQEAIRWADGAEVRPDTAQANARAERWSPYRSCAAHMLWRWYRAVKSGDVPRPTVAAMS
ncbi:MAG TPA: DNA-3-methyladenine glycosylase 2 family protein [Caulobacteraceae bacterium]|nr:DNA-3-methyladenine glycosylase 2 family protein [Caulobacteraceae bacterium]